MRLEPQVCIFRDSGGALSEATLYFPEHGAITMADLAFAGYKNKQMDSNPISALFGKVGAPVNHLEPTRLSGSNPVRSLWVGGGLESA